MTRALCVTLLVLAGPAHADDAVYEHGVVTVPAEQMGKVTAVVINNALGSVRVTGHDKPTIELNFDKRAGDEAALAALKVWLSNGVPGRIDIRAGSKPGTSPEVAMAGARVDLELAVPRSLFVQVAAGQGNIELAGTNRGADLSAHPGTIDVRNCSGPIRTETSAGRQELQDIAGDVAARGLFGDIRMRVVRGDDVMATNHAGSLFAHRVTSARLTLFAAVGDVEVVAAEVPAQAQWRIASLTGDVRFSILPGARAIVRVRRRAGNDAVQWPDGVARVRVTNGWDQAEVGSEPAANQVQLASESGEIRVRFAVAKF